MGCVAEVKDGGQKKFMTLRKVRAGSDKRDPNEMR
jgi:hypothetical protein